MLINLPDGEYTATDRQCLVGLIDERVEPVVAIAHAGVEINPAFILSNASILLQAVDLPVIMPLRKLIIVFRYDRKHLNQHSRVGCRLHLAFVSMEL